MSTRVDTPAIATIERERSLNPTTALWGVLIAGLLLRLLFVGAQGYTGDVSSFMSWAMTAAGNPLSIFYDKAGFADYPPGYLLVLWLLGEIYKPFAHGDPSFSVLHTLVKMPGIVFDLIDAGLIYLIVRRYASQTWAVIAAALYALNPATIYISSYWGQVDSVPAGFMLGALTLLLYASERPALQERLFVVGAWLSLGYAILIKPPAVMMAILFVAFAFATADAAVRKKRITNTVLGAVAAFVMANLVSLLFHPNLITVTGWLIERYRFGSSVYAYNSVNAFNLHSVFRPFWQSDSELVKIGPLVLGPMWMWGVLLVGAATVLVVTRYLQRRDDVALIEASMLLALGFFVLATRMHERYVFNALVLMVPLAPLGRRYLLGIAALALTLLVNLAYSLNYMHVMNDKVVGVNPIDLWPYVTHPLSALNVVVFFALGYAFLGGAIGRRVDASSGEGSIPSVSATPTLGALWLGRPWFGPLQGLVAMRRLDWLIAGGYLLVAFILNFVNYQNPPGKYFDEIYYPTSGLQYLKGIPAKDWEFPLEWTHPPLTKLIITLSMWMFGGVAHGDTGWGWRFLNVVCGALIVPLLYVFAKRLTASTLFASIAAFMFLFDGFRYVQSRISTPEIFVATLSLLVLYAFYRFWTAAQVRLRRIVPGAFGTVFWAALVAGSAVAAGFSYLVNHLGAAPPNANSYGVAFVYGELGAYLLARLMGRRLSPPSGAITSYAEGTRVVPDIKGGIRLERFDGGGAGALQFDELKIDARGDGTLVYATPDGSATFSPEATMYTTAGTLRRGEATTWFLVLCFAMALLASSKWNGLFDFFTIVSAIAVVVVQRFIKRPALFGNPYGFTPDIVLGAVLFIGATVYALSYTPNFLLGYNLPDIVGMQQQMYWYHSKLSQSNPASLNHPYGSYWWQWPTLFAPISYFWNDSRTGAALSNGAACCVAEVIALPNPVVWWFGLASVPLMAWWGWKERNKGYLLLAAAYLFHWLPWIVTPRISFLYHFFPNLAIIVLANTVVLQRLWQKKSNRAMVYYYLAGVFAAFVFFYPILAATPMTYDQWHQRMWLDNWLDILHVHPHGLSWIKPN